MSTRNIFICCVVCFILGAGVCWFAQSGQRQAGRDSVVEAENMASLVAGLGSTLDEFRAYRERTDEWISHLEANNIEFGRIVLSIRSDTSELAIRYRELEGRLAELGIELPGIVADVSSVADDIGIIIDSVESGEVEAVD